LERVSAALFRRNKIKAIKAYREYKRVSLEEAKQVVEALEAELWAIAPEKFAAHAPSLRIVTLIIFCHFVIVLSFALKSYDTALQLATGEAQWSFKIWWPWAIFVLVLSGAISNYRLQRKWFRKS